MYVLDEPSIGLHQRDNDRLIGTLKHLRDLGNSVLVVEHDEDAILAESRGHAPEGMAAKMVLGRALAQNRPLWNYIGTFQEHDFTRLREPDEVAGIMAASSAVGANPWIVFYGFEGPENQPSVQVIESQMRLWDDYPELFTGEDRADVAVILPPSSRDHTGEPMPPDMLARLLAAGTYDQGFATVEFVASAMVDLEFHTGTPPADPMQKQAEVLEGLGMPRAIRMRHATPQFAHVFSGDGYSSGYYSYMWSEVMDADAFAAFEETGDPFDPATAARLEKFIPVSYTHLTLPTIYSV